MDLDLVVRVETNTPIYTSAYCSYSQLAIAASTSPSIISRAGGVGAHFLWPVWSFLRWSGERAMVLNCWSHLRLYYIRCRRLPCPTMHSLDNLPLLRYWFYTQLFKLLTVEQMRRKELLTDPWFQFFEILRISKLWRHISYFANRTLPLENPRRLTFQITLDPQFRIYTHT